MPTIALLGSEFEENLSLRYLAAAVAQDGVTAEIVAVNGPADEAEAVRRVLALDPALVGISVPFQMRARELLGLADRLRAAGYRGHVVAGGHFATFEFESILRDHPAIDSVVRHEGEDTLRELCRDVLAGEAKVVPGLVLRTPAGFEAGPARALPRLDTVAAPTRPAAVQDILGVPCAPLLGSRGCYADCSFCCIHAYAEAAKGPRYRRRSVASIVDEMAAEYHGRGVRLFVFHDDNFFLPHQPTNLARYTEMAERLRDAGLTDIGLVIKCRPNDVDPELFRVLQGMGMMRAYVGIESSSPEGVISLNRRITPDDNRRALALFEELGVYCSFNMLIFDPEATLEGIGANLAFMDEFAQHPHNFCRAEVYAGTPLKAILESQGRLRGDYRAWTYEMRDPRVELLFRIFSTAWATRNFKPDGVANLMMGIRFDSEVVRRFYPDAWDDDWHRALVALTERVNRDSVARMREALAFVVGVDLRDHAGAKAFTLGLARDLARADLAFLGEIKAHRRDMERRIALAGGPLTQRAFAGGRAPWAAETGRLGSSAGTDFSTELLPAPSEA